MSSQSRLMPISYYNPKQFIRLNAYAGLIVYEKDPSRLLLRAIRFGGEPEMVRALADALYAGAELEVEIGPDKFYFTSEPRKFQRQLSHDGLYAEAVLLAQDDEQEIETEEQSDEQQQITDGECARSDEHVNQLQQERAIYKFKVTGVLLDTDETATTFSLTPLCQQIFRTSQIADIKLLNSLATQWI